MNFDLIFKDIGELGRYQLFLVAVCAWTMIPFACNISAVIFLGYREPSRCSFPELEPYIESGNISEKSLIGILSPDYTPDKHSICMRYTYNATPCPNNTFLCLFINESGPNTSDWKSTVDVITCPDGYHFDRELFEQTIRAEWDLVCEKSNLNSLATAIFCFGMLLGSLFGGSLADRYGRIPTLAVGTLMNVALGVGCSFSQTFETFMVLRCFIGICCVVTQIAMATYTVEIVGKKQRPWIGLLVGTLSGLGYMFLSMLAYFFRHWRTLQLTLGIISLPLLVMAPFIPESPRLLFAHGKKHKAKKVCQVIARKNGTILTEQIWKEAESNEVFEAKKRFFPQRLLQHRRMMILLLINTVQFFVSGLVFFCLSFNVGHWFGNPFLNNALSGLVEFVACVLVVPAINRIGRRGTIVASLTVAGICIPLAEVLKSCVETSTVTEIAQVAFLLTAKFTIAGSFNLLFLYTAELFPTEVRNTALGICTVGGRSASIVAPFLLEAQHIASWPLSLLLGVSSLLSALMACKCPETKGKLMLTSLKEAENLYKKKKHADDLINNNREEFMIDNLDNNELATRTLSLGSQT